MTACMARGDYRTRGRQRKPRRHRDTSTEGRKLEIKSPKSRARGSGSAAPSANHESDHGSTDGPHREDGNIGFGDDGIWQTQQKAEHKADNPSRPRKVDRSDHEPNGEAIYEGSKNCGPLIGKAHGQHDRHIQSAESQTANHT